MDNISNISINELEELLELKKSEVKKSEKASKKKSKSLTNLKVMDYLVIICIVSIILFAGISLYQYYANGIPVSEIKTEIFAFFGAELLAMAGISISNNMGKKGGE